MMERAATTWFTCPGCLSRGEPSSRRVDSAKVVGGIQYCGLCAGEIIDEVTCDVFTAATSGVIAWEDGGGKHELRLSIEGGRFTIDVAEKHPHVIATTSHCYRSRDFSKFWDWLATFVEHHLAALQRAVAASNDT